MSTISESPLVRKIRALRAKAEDPSVTEAEAALFAAKVQELLAVNGLSMSDVETKTEDRENVNAATHDDKKWKSPARKHLLRAVCRYYMCEAIGPGRGYDRWTIVGKPTNVFVALEMVDYLIGTTVRISNRYGRENVGSNVIDFRRGCMTRLAERLDALRNEEAAKKQEWKAPGNPGNLPALFASERQQVEQYMKQKLDVKYAKHKHIKQGDDAARGRAAADGISLHRQVGGQGGGGRLMIGSK